MLNIGGRIKSALDIVRKTDEAGKYIEKGQIGKAQRALQQVVEAFRTIHDLIFNEDEKKRLFPIFAGALDAHDLKRALDAMRFSMTDDVRTDIIAAMSRSRFPNITKDDLQEIASGRKANGGKLTSDEHDKWAARAIEGTYLTPTLDEALDSASKMKNPDRQVPYALHVLKGGIGMIRQYAEGLKGLNVPEAVFVEHMAGLIRSGRKGEFEAAQLSEILSLGPSIVGKAFMQVYGTPERALAPHKESKPSTDTGDTPTKASKPWLSGIGSFIRRRGSKEEPTVTEPILELTPEQRVADSSKKPAPAGEMKTAAAAA